MMPEHLDRIDEIFQAALDLPPAERSAYLDQACAGEDALRTEIQSLISAYERSDGFIETPALEVHAAVIAGSPAKSIVGQSIGHYRIVRALGAGGMGEVYLAADTRTERKVALKLLPDYLANDGDRVRRFQQEARAALTLNHPNIVTIYEIGEANGSHFIATEWIQGDTLRHRLGQRPLSISEALDIAIQVAAALSEAHRAGIIHRDIKPENIMLRPDGYVKMLDFGIAKLTELQKPASAPEAPTALQVKTAPGMVMGTANYMSPEQARGLPVDQRTDTWSLGVVLYEMVAGCVPFAGETSGDAIAAILEKQPAPLARYSREAPEALEEIVTTALAKERDERFQTATQMMAALRRLKQRLDVAAELERSMPPHTADIAIVTGSRGETGPGASRPTSVPRTSSAEFIVGEIKRHRRGAAIIFTLLAIALAGGGYGLYRMIRQGRAPSPFQSMRFTRLTTSGKAIDSAISPDGKYVAYTSVDGGRMSIWLRQVATSSNVKIAETELGFPRGLTFSPDGNYLYYRARTEVPTGGGNVSALFRIPVPLGGDARKVIGALTSPISFSPDGRLLAFVRNNQPVFGESYLIIANADGTGERIIKTHKLSEAFSNPGWSIAPAWSPDGKSLACASGVRPSSLIEVQVEGGAEKPIGAQPWAFIEHLAWLADGSALILTGQDGSSAHVQIWQVSYPSGEARRISNDLNSYRGMSLTMDSSTMAVVQISYQSDIWVMPNGKTSEARRITSGTGNADGYRGVSWTPGGGLIYASSATGNWELWSIDASGSNQKQLTSEGYQNAEPIITADGRYIVFFSDRSGELSLWRADVDGGNPKRLATSKLTNTIASCSPDGKQIVYTAVNSQSTPGLWKVGIDGGDPVQLTDKYWSELPSVSPDGKQIAFQYFGEGKPATIVSVSIDGGPITQIGQLPQRVFGRLQWTPDGSSIAYVDQTYIGQLGGTFNLWALPVGGGAPKQLTDFKSDQIFWFDWSKDGKQLAVARGTEIGDVVLISNFK